MRNRASGFCYVADIVLGIMLLAKQGSARCLRPLALGTASKSPESRQGAAKEPSQSSVAPLEGPMRRARVMYLDLDIHEGDGVHQAFLSPTKFPSTDLPPSGNPRRPPKAPQVLTLSIHHHSRTFFPPHRPFSGLPDPHTAHPFTLSIPLHAYPSAKTYHALWPNVQRIKEAFGPDYVVLQLGVDGLPGDRVGQYGAWSVVGKGGVAWCVDRVRDWGLPLCVLGGGGYDHPNTARAWATATSVLVSCRTGRLKPFERLWLMKSSGNILTQRLVYPITTTFQCTGPGSRSRSLRVCLFPYQHA
jgi:acetoin utilization deacetylase AcuC-like enzyme